jgi:hypothetical protein
MYLGYRSEAGSRIAGGRVWDGEPEVMYSISCSERRCFYFGPLPAPLAALLTDLLTFDAAGLAIPI